ncbi:MAG: proline--tRNA ligase [Clostridiales Family XIII bacterium]|jgi:prolyl-tRNA synthetase|nr:proline--tRNA ligase [Clostridiales Family XIII bacterium]
MKLSKAHIHTLREVPGEAEVPSHIWLLRAGMMRKTVSGVYSFMQFGWRTLRKIEEIIRQEMDAAGGQEISTSPIQPAELWHESGRWGVYGPELWRLKDRHGREFALGPTAEEVVTDIIRNEVDSWRQLPINLYQIQLKYRDEARPRYGLMRSREFIMKDSYSFDRDEEGFEKSYAAMREAYTKIFTRCGLTFRPVAADNGAIGGSGSEEFMAMSDVGESDIVYCEKCDMAATTELAAGVDAAPDVTEMLPLEDVLTPATKTIEAVASYLGLSKEQTLKALLFDVYNEVPNAKGEYEHKEYVVAFLRGDREINKVKLINALGIAEHLIEFADEVKIGSATGCVGGFTGPVGLHDCRIIADSEVVGLKNLCAGANKVDHHTKNINYGRDWTADIVTDLKLVGEGDACPVCGNPLRAARGIEVGQIFHLGAKYSAKLGAKYRDEKQEEHLIEMGCYGIGVTRTMAAVVEQSHDENGIIWPISIAPYHVILTQMKPDDAVQTELAESLYKQFWDAGVETVWDERDERPGVKFKDADIFGIPIRITVGKKAAEGIVEFKLRREKENEELPVAEAVERVFALVI